MSNQLLSSGPVSPSANLTASEPAERLVRLLDSEIDHLRTERTRGGWTAWALVIALGGILAAAVDIWERGPVNFRLVALLFALFSVSSDLVVQSLVSGNASVIEGVGRFRIGTVFGWRPGGLLVVALQRALVAVTAMWAAPLAPAWIVRTIAAWYGFASVTSLLVALFISRLPIWRKPPGFGLKMVGITTNVLAIVGAASYLTVSGLMAPGKALSEARLAFLLTAGVYISMFLLMERQREPLLESLVQVRRDLALGNVSFADAENQTRVALTGLAAGDWIQPVLKALLESYNRQLTSVQAAVDLAERSSQELERLRELAANSQTDTALASTIVGRIDPITRLVSDSSEAYKEIVRRSGEIAFRFGFMRKSVPNLGELEAEYDRAVQPLINESIEREVRITHGVKAFAADVRRSLVELGYE